MLAVVAVVGFLFFLAWELTEKHPIVDLRLFARRNFLMGTVALSVAYGLFFGNVVLLPLWLQQYMGYTATWAGLATAPVGILAIVLSPWVGKNVAQDRSAQARDASPSSASRCVLWMRSHFNTQADFETILIPTVLQGAAMAFFFIPLQAIMFSGLTPERMPAAAGLSQLRAHHRRRDRHLDLHDAVGEPRDPAPRAARRERSTAASSAATHDARPARRRRLRRREQALATINRMVDQQAYTMAANDLFLLSSVLFLLLLVFVWMTRPAQGAAAGAGGAH